MKPATPTGSLMTDHRVIGHMVTRNELGRYLPSTIAWLRTLTDDQVHVYDDRSTDGTYEYLSDEDGVVVDCRLPGGITFAEDESAFRSVAWHAMEARFSPGPQDWVLCMDADEYLVSREPERFDLAADIEEALTAGLGAVSFPVAEVFDWNSHPLIRVDGYWGQINACRLVRWRPEGTFVPRREGGGSVPTGWQAPHLESNNFTILHLGYARLEDRRVRYARYAGGVGHNPRHIKSILTSPDLQPFNGQHPPLERLP